MADGVSPGVPMAEGRCRRYGTQPPAPRVSCLFALSNSDMSSVQHLARLAHRHVWQRLPRTWRRSALVAVTTALAPRPQGATAVPRIIVVGYLTAASGLGASARLCHDALRAAGMPVMGVDLTREFRQDGSRVPFSFVDGRTHRGPATVILHVNAPLVPLAMWWLGSTFVRDKFVVAYWAWELPVAPDEWRAGLRFVHHILVPSTFTSNAVRELRPTQPVDVLVHPVVGPEPAKSSSLPIDKPFTVLVVFNMASGFQRKNPMASVAAFKTAFGEDAAARLIIKLQNPASYPEGAEQLRRAAASQGNIDIDDRNLPQEEMAELFARCDVVLSLHRSEGFGLVIAEAMLAARPVVATNWSGNTDFLTGDCGIPVGYRLVPATDPQGEYDHPGMCWAEADVDEAAAALRRLRDDPDLRRQLGQTAYQRAVALFSAEAYRERLKSRLKLA